MQVLHHALTRQHDRGDDGERQQHPDRAAGQIDPEVADRAERRRDEAADQRDRDGEPTAADTKFCTVRPAIWVRWLIVGSPP